jgi:hypothetical protein
MMPRIVLVTAVLALLAPPLPGEEPKIDGKTIAELEADIDKRIADRREDQKAVSDYRSFAKREESKLNSLGKSLAHHAAKYRNQESSAFVLYLFEAHKGSLDLLTRLKIQYSKSSRKFMQLQEVYIAIAWNYARLGRPTEASTTLAGIVNRGGFKNRIEGEAERMRRFPALRKVMKEAFHRRDLNPRSADVQWELVRTLGDKVFFPFRERLELLWMEKAYAKHKAVDSGEVEWRLILNSLKLMDFTGAVKRILSMNRNRRFKDFWTVKNGEAYYQMGWAYMQLGDWKKSQAAFQQLAVKHPKHQNVENGRVNNHLRYVKNKDKAKAKMDPLPMDWGREK